MTIERIARASLLLACSLLLSASPAFAERYALLVGVSTYAANAAAGGALDLEGPAEDVPALRRTLIDRQAFIDRNIVTLVDAAATRQAILDRLTSMVAAMRDGDYLLFYFSGHGTSAFDAKMQPVSSFIGPNSGALAPYDLQVDSTERAAASLLIGRRDLRPILERLPKGSQALVILDACYSENAMRSIRQRAGGRTRGITLGTLVPAASLADRTGVGGADIAAMAEAERAYPYSNVFALTAASKDEQAKDIDSLLKVDGKYPTVDGKPHGAFTNSLLEGLSGAADSNRDGTLTLQELHEFSRRSVQTRFAHTPQLLAPPSIAATTVAALGETRKAIASPGCASAARATQTPVSVRLESVESRLADRLRAQPNVRIVATGADLVIVQGAGGLADVYDASGSLVRQFRATEGDALVARVEAEPALQQFLASSVTCQSFNASLHLLPEGQARFSAKDKLTIQAVVDRDAYLVLFNVDKSGTVSLVYPAMPAERARQVSGRPLTLATARAAAPFGSEHLKLMAFATEPPFETIGCRTAANGNLDCPDAVPGTRSFDALLAWLEQAKAGAESHIRFTTYEE